MMGAEAEHGETEKEQAEESSGHNRAHGRPRRANCAARAEKVETGGQAASQGRATRAPGIACGAPLVAGRKRWREGVVWPRAVAPTRALPSYFLNLT